MSFSVTADLHRLAEQRLATEKLMSPTVTESVRRLAEHRPAMEKLMSPTITESVRRLAEHRPAMEKLITESMRRLAEHRPAVEKLMSPTVIESGIRFAERRLAMEKLMSPSVTESAMRLAEHRSAMEKLMSSSVTESAKRLDAKQFLVEKMIASSPAESFKRIAGQQSVIDTMMSPSITESFKQLSTRSLIEKMIGSSLQESATRRESLVQRIVGRSLLENVLRQGSAMDETMRFLRVVQTRSATEGRVDAARVEGLHPLEVLEALDRLNGQSLVDALTGAHGVSSLSDFREAASATLGLSHPAAGMLTGLVGEELSSTGAVVEQLNPLVLSSIALFDVLLALLARLGELGRNPKVQALVIQLLVASVPAAVIAVWQSHGSDKQHTEEMVILEKIVDELADKTEPAAAVRAVVVRPKAQLRSKATTKSTSLGVLEAGDELLILGRSNGWLLVRAGVTGGEIRTGWVYGKFVKALI